MRKRSGFLIGLLLCCGALGAGATPLSAFGSIIDLNEAVSPIALGGERAVGACCRHNATGAVVCVLTSWQECEQVFQGVYQGDGTSCNPSPCGQVPEGACCVSVAGAPPQCFVAFALECELHGGLYQGDGSSCNPNPCQPPTGACCFREPATGQWACVIVSAADCDTQYGGLYQGDNTNCGPPLPCESPEPNGACCYLDAAGTVQCIVVSAYECEVAYHGVYHGDGSSCTPLNPCTELGACCYPNPNGSQCVVTTPADCDAIYNGTFLGFGSQCTSQGTCPDPNATGACCYATPALCVITTQNDCYAIYGGTYLGDGTPCVPNPCLPPGAGACCVLDNTGNSACVTATQTQCEEVLHGVFYGVGTPCTPETCPNIPPKCDCPGRCDNRTPTFQDPAWAPFTGPAAICTHYDWYVTGYSLVCVDIKNKGSAPLNTNWGAAALYSHPSWTLANLGTVFGVTVDTIGNTYVTASTSYNGNQTGSGGWGTVYKIDAVSGLPTVFANLPNTGPGLGNIAYDSKNNQLFVTNFEDGRIYRLDMTGACLSTFDHATGTIGGCAPEAGDPVGFAALGERPWGVNVWNDRLYYGLWVEDSGRPSATASNQVWSIALVAGNFSGVKQLEINLPVLGSGYNESNPPSDISFSQTGCMLVSERSMYLDDQPSAHQSRVLEYRQIGPIWWPSSVTFQVGVLGSGANAAGGADYDKDGDVWATGDALQFGPQIIYGLQGLPCDGGGVTQSILVDLNGNLGFGDKTQIGDVEVTCFGPRGACCYQGPDGPICAEMTFIECEQLHGQYQGDGTDCNPNPCLPTGACCYVDPTGPQCIITTQADCVQIYNGTYIGDNVPCNPNPCAPTGEGACCVHDNNGNSLCVTATQTQCEELLGGVFFGIGTPCTPNLCPNTSEKCDCPGRCDNQTPSFEDPAWAPFTGPAAICTHHDPFVTGFSVVCVDIKNKGSAPLNTNWNATTLYSHPSWALANLGTVFGVTVDRNGNVYVTASTSYWANVLGVGTWGTVYKIDANTGLPSVFANLPNTGPGLGNITYDGTNNQLFVTNFEDGRIYRLDMTGACLGTFDHATGLIGGCAPEAGDPAGFAALGERPWGVNVWNNRLYYGLWVEDMGRPNAAAANQVWSIALAGGNFSGAAQLDINLPTLGTFYNYSSPPSDISFSETGCMLISERSMYADDQPSAHQSRVLEYRQIGPIWWPSPVTYKVGVLGNGENAAGGADFDEDGDVWATGDALQFGPQVIYGLQGLPCTGGDVTQSILVDLNGDVTFQDKTLIGDVEVTCFSHCTPPPRKMVAWYPLDETSGATALDIAWGNNAAYTGTTSIAGMVLQGRRFNGSTDFAKAPNAPQINFGQGNFSIDLWLRTTATTGLPIILDKRSSAIVGYSLFLYNGQPGIQLADASSYANFIATPNIADGKWHHLAVTVNRTSATGIKFYIDGTFVQAFNPLGWPGSLSNTFPLWIGVREPTLGGGGNWPGDLDEIELFNTELNAATVLRVYKAGREGKCKERAYLPPVTSYCPNENVKSVPFTIYNDSGNTYSHDWFLLGNNLCAVPGPLAAGFAPQNWTGAVITGNNSQTWPINITRPAGLVAPLSACYDATVTNTTIGYQFGTSASLKATSWKWCFIVLDPIPIDHIPFPGHRAVSFGVTNTDTTPDTLDYRIVGRSSDGDATNRVISLNGLPPGEPVLGSILVAPGAMSPVTVEVSFTEHQPFDFHDIVLEADTDGDGEFEPLEALGVQSVLPRRGDMNCDGVVNFGDINPFVLYLSNFSAWQTTYSGCLPENGDINGDSTFPAFGDINPFVALLSSGG